MRRSRAVPASLAIVRIPYPFELSQRRLVSENEGMIELMDTDPAIPRGLKGPSMLEQAAGSRLGGGERLDLVNHPAMIPLSITLTRPHL